MMNIVLAIFDDYLIILTFLGHFLLECYFNGCHILPKIHRIAINDDLVAKFLYPLGDCNG